MLAFRPELPALRRGDAFLAKEVGDAFAREQTAAVDPGPEIGRDSHVGRHRDDAGRRRRPRALKGTWPRNDASSGCGSRNPSKGSHSCPVRTFIAVCSVATWSGVIRPAWLSLWPWKGRPKPLMV